MFFIAREKERKKKCNNRRRDTPLRKNFVVRIHHTRLDITTMRGVCPASTTTTTTSSSSTSANFSASKSRSRRSSDWRLGAIGLESNWRRGGRIPLKKSSSSSSSSSRGEGFYALAKARSKDDEERPIVVIDNYDSFTYNLVQYLGDCVIKDQIVFKND